MTNILAVHNHNDYDNEEHQVHVYTRSKRASKKQSFVFILLSTILSGVIFSCILIGFVAQSTSMQLPCISQYYGDPFTQSVRYIKIGPPYQPENYIIRFGRTHPMNTGFDEDITFEISIPLGKPHTCTP